MEDQKFRELVAAAIDELPAVFRQKLNNVYVVVEDFPAGEVMREQKIRSPFGLLGLYHGFPLKERGVYYTNVLPDRITLYRKPIEALCRDETQVKEKIKEVLTHEVGHHFGFDEQELERI